MPSPPRAMVRRWQVRVLDTATRKWTPVRFDNAVKAATAVQDMRERGVHVTAVRSIYIRRDHTR